jgi:hypothetical protein
MLAGIGTRVWRDYPAAVRACVAVRDRFAASDRQQRLYESPYTRFRTLYPAIKQEFRKL